MQRRIKTVGITAMSKSMREDGELTYEATAATKMVTDDRKQTQQRTKDEGTDSDRGYKHKPK